MGKAAFVPEDFFHFRLVGEPQLSPFGDEVAYVLRTIDAEENRYRSTIQLVSVAGGMPLQLTSGHSRDHAPRWSPDRQQIAFLSDRSGSEQIWLIPRHGGEAIQLTHLADAPELIGWSPDGTQLFFTAAVSPKGLESEAEKKQREEQRSPREKFTADVRDITRLWYRLDSVGYFDDRRRHLFRLEIASQKVHALTQGEYDVQDPTLSPDGKWIAFAANRSPQADRFPEIQDIWLLPVEGGEPRRLTEGAWGCALPRFSPIADRIAFFYVDPKRFGYGNTRLGVVTTAARPQITPLTSGWDNSFTDLSMNDLHGHAPQSAPFWAPDGKMLYALASLRGTTQLCAIDADKGDVQVLTHGNHCFYGMDVIPGAGRFVVARTTGEIPGDLYVATLDQPDPLQPLTSVNTDWMNEREVAVPHRIDWHNRAGQAMDGWLIQPVDTHAGEKAPTVIEVHGGPMMMYGDAFFFEFQLLATAGFAVAYCNPRGSQGYGEKFCACIAGDWGHLDWEDIQDWTDRVGQEPGIDADRLGIAGGSYGGYMTNWAIGHTDRFQAAVTMRSVVNEFSMFGTSDLTYTEGGDFGEFGGPPWEVPERYRRVSPLTFAGQMHTPTLILHSEQDYRCPISEGEQLYMALRFRGVETEFVRFPNESHELSRAGQPWHRLLRLEKIVDWFARHLQQSEE
ncbi:MAG: S9 family peptidase [Firmicutes bacterium]|nr:S9 family peptidase [Bacillota bacterium]